jgi:hypothetical protein
MNGHLSEAESKEKNGVRDPMPELTITSTYVHSRVHSNIFTMVNPMPESTLTLCQSRLYPPVRIFGFGLGLGLTNFTSKTQLPNIRNKYSQERELRGYSPSSYIHVSVSDLYIPLIGLPILLQEKIGGPNVGTYCICRSLTDT